MVRLHILYDIDGWAYYWTASALRRYAPDGFKVTLSRLARRDDVAEALPPEAPDILFVPDRTKIVAVRREITRRGWQTKVVGSWSLGWPMGWDHFHAIYSEVDALVILNRECWVRSGRLQHTICIPNGVDRDVFRMKVPFERRAPRILWVGSEYHRAVKGYDDFVVPLGDRLKHKGIDFEFRLVDSYGEGLASPQEMADWYNTGTVLITVSRHEGTPNPCLEAAACGCTIVAVPVGNMPELVRSGVNGFLVERDLDAVLGAIDAANADYPSLAARMQEDIAGWGWETRAPTCYELFRSVLADRAVSSFPEPLEAPVDLTEELTVFVSTVGAPTLDSCMRHLEHQDSLFDTKVVRDTPMRAALQKMVDECDTPFYVQVDEGMLLYPHAVRTLYEKISNEAPDTAMVVANLYDTHLDRCISGVRILRKEIAARFPFRDIQSCEKDHDRRMEKAGFRISSTRLSGATRLSEGTLGLHGTHSTPSSAYERYRTVDLRR